MRIGARWLVIAALSASARGTGAQSLGSERHDFAALGGDVWSTLISAAHTDRRAVPPIVGTATGVVAVGAFVDSALYAWMSANPNALVIHALFPIREGWKLPLYELGSGQYLLPVSGVLYATGRLMHNSALRDAGLGCAAAHLSSASLRDVIYLLVSRERPRVSPSADRIGVPGDRDWDDHSFLSGHVANSMSCASYIGHRFTLGPIEPAMYGYVTLIGLGRLADGRHWASDTMAAAVMGFAIGKAIADRQLHRNGASTEGLARTARTPLIAWSIAF